MKKLRSQMCTLFAAVAVFVGTLMSEGACIFDFYQPEMPDKMRK